MKTQIFQVSRLSFFATYYLLYFVAEKQTFIIGICSGQDKVIRFESNLQNSIKLTLKYIMR